MADTPTPARDRIAAITISLLVHALVLAPVLVWQAGGRSGTGPRKDAAGDGQAAWIAADFLAQPATPARPAVATVPPPTAAVAAAPATEPPPPAQHATTGDAPTAAVAPAEARTGGGDGTPQDDLDARYLAAVRAAILGHWHAQGGGAIPAGCTVTVDQAEGGHALRAWVMHCGDLPLRDRIRLESAVMQVQPLPYAGFEPVFQAHLKLTF